MKIVFVAVLGVFATGPAAHAQTACQTYGSQRYCN